MDSPSRTIFGFIVTHCTANEGPMRIQYKCLVPVYVFPEMKLLFPKHNYNVLSPMQFLHSYICERFIYFQDLSLPILLQGNTVCGPILGIYKSLTET